MKIKKKIQEWLGIDELATNNDVNVKVNLVAEQIAEIRFDIADITRKLEEARKNILFEGCTLDSNPTGKLFSRLIALSDELGYEFKEIDVPDERWELRQQLERLTMPTVRRTIAVKKKIDRAK